ncbi:MAG: hypothetical protein IJ287_10420 [Methanobrevibacter sp.]|nr:hypothetical protein [Methanobrevibacter sp.]
MPLDNNTNAAKIIPIITIGAIRYECSAVVSNPTIIIPKATNDVKYTITSSLFMLPLL